MGWSADAIRWGDEWRYLKPDLDPELFLEFTNAAEEVNRLAGSVDAGLYDGGLVCSTSVGFLMQAVGEFPRGGGVILPEEVQERGAVANWSLPGPNESHSLWGYWAAFKFFELCIRHNLGIWIEPGRRPLR